MSHEVYYQFPQTDGQARRAGARGGKTAARNRRERLEGAPAAGPQAEAGVVPQFPPPTTAAAIALLDAHYPWLRGAEKRLGNRSPRKRQALPPGSCRQEGSERAVAGQVRCTSSRGSHDTVCCAPPFSVPTCTSSSTRANL
jgi:hypothetical protein